MVASLTCYGVVVRVARAPRRLAASLLAAFALVGAAWSCSFPDVDRLGKACEDSCAPYFCVERICVASPPDARVLPTDAPADAPADADAADRADALVPGPCVPKPALDGGTIVFRDCFDDREADQAIGFDTPWPNPNGVATLDRSAQVSGTQSLLFRSGGFAQSANSGPIMRGGAPARQLACTFWVRFDALVGTMEFLSVQTILVAPSGTPAPDEVLALGATPLGQGLTWRPRYQVSQLDAAAPAVTDTVLTSSRTQWTKISTVMRPGSIVIRVGDSTQTITGRAALSITELSVRVGVLTQDGSNDQVVRYDDVICDVSTAL